MKPIAVTPYIPNISTALPFLAGETWWQKLLRTFIHYVTGLYPSARILARADAQWNPEDNRFQEILHCAKVTLDATGTLPTHGAAIVVANHPTGPMDGIVFGAWLTAQRSDVRILTTEALATIPSLRDWVIPLRLYDGPHDEQSNAQSLRKVIAHLRRGGVIAVFPAGRIELPDPHHNSDHWQDSIFSIAHRFQVPIHCVRLHQQHATWVTRLLKLHAWIRTLSMGWLFLLMCHKRHQLSIEHIIQAHDDVTPSKLRDMAFEVVNPSKKL